MNIRSFGKKLAVGSTLALIAGAASAQTSTGPDVSGIVTVIVGCLVAVGTIGTAVLSVYYGAKIYKWLKVS